MGKYIFHEEMRDANFYLQGSLVKYRGMIVRVDNVNRDGYVNIMFGSSYETVAYSDLDLSPIELGYVFNEDINKPAFFERIPRRQWRQGLTPNAIHDKMGRSSIGEDMSSSMIRQLERRDYPSILRALRIAKERKTVVPFNKNYAIDGNRNVLFKTKKIGKFDQKSKEFTFIEPYSFLLPELQEINDVYN